jgi:hypothetical protein
MTRIGPIMFARIDDYHKKVRRLGLSEIRTEPVAEA